MLICMLGSLCFQFCMKNKPLTKSPHSKEQDPESSWSALATLVVGLVYFLIARLNIELTAPDSGASPAYIPAGLAVALSILYGRVTWPGIAMGTLLIEGIFFAGFRTMDFHDIQLALPFVCCDEHLASVAMC